MVQSNEVHLSCIDVTLLLLKLLFSFYGFDLGWIGELTGRKDISFLAVQLVLICIQRDFTK